MKFVLEDKELENAMSWMSEQMARKPGCGSDGSRFSYEFTPTGLGMCVAIIDGLTKERKNVTDVSNW